MFIRSIKKSERLFYSVAVIVFGVLCELFARVVIARITNIDYDIIAANKGTVWVLQKLLTILLVLLVCLLLWTFRKSSGVKFKLSFAMLTSLALVLSGFICVGITYMSGYSVKNRGTMAVGVIALLIVFDGIICFLFVREGRHNREKLRLQALQSEIESSKANLEEYKATGEKLHKVKHEIGRVVEMTKLMLEKCEYDKAKQYLSEFYAISDDIKADYKFSNNLVLDYVVSKYKKLCVKEGMTFKCLIGDGMINLEDGQLHILLENLLENAFEAAMRADTSDRLIDMQLDTRDGQLFIRITNSSRREDFDAIKKKTSTKADGKNHG
ncbi:MAG: GHKL domain-containing protein, partial [Lachnospiraceae bacterium]